MVGALDLEREQGSGQGVGKWGGKQGMVAIGSFRCCEVRQEQHACSLSAIRLEEGCIVGFSRLSCIRLEVGGETQEGPLLGELSDSGPWPGTGRVRLGMQLSLLSV